MSHEGRKYQVPDDRGYLPWHDRFHSEKRAFCETGPFETVGFVTCGGCPGKRVIPGAKLLVDRGAGAIVFASCGNPIGYPCPHYANMRDAVRRAIGNEIKIIEWIH